MSKLEPEERVLEGLGSRPEKLNNYGGSWIDSQRGFTYNMDIVIGIKGNQLHVIKDGVGCPGVYTDVTVVIDTTKQTYPLTIVKSMSVRLKEFFAKNLPHRKG